MKKQNVLHAFLSLHKFKRMRKKIVAGNWKMNTNLQEALALASELKKHRSTDSAKMMVVCPPFPWIFPVKETLNGSDIFVGAQNCSDKEQGAFTGEVSANMLASAGVSHVILGHSERRALFGETDEQIALKIQAALSKGLQVIFCCGETLEERNAGNLENILKTQIEVALSPLSPEDVSNIVIAYEPVWAIGTGVTASPDQAQEVHAFIRAFIAQIFTEEIANHMSILYGGSCNAQNASTLFSQNDIDGGLIGGAALKSADFIAIFEAL
jgi:triosephosphate isomerase